MVTRAEIVYSPYLKPTSKSNDELQKTELEHNCKESLLLHYYRSSYAQHFHLSLITSVIS